MNITFQSILYLLVALVVLGAFYALVDYIIRAIPIADPLGRIIRVVTMVICVLAAIFILLQFAGMGGGVTVNTSMGYSPHGLLHEVTSLRS